MSSDQVVLLIYIIFLMMGGLMGFVKAGSKASLIASSIFSMVLLLFLFNVFPFVYNWIVLVFLLVFFGMRLAKSKKMMPNGMMVALTILALILQQIL
jgi:uncharacterized membrane protein (UPF0136 family)